MEIPSKSSGFKVQGSGLVQSSRTENQEPKTRRSRWINRAKSLFSELRHNAFVSTSILSGTGQIIVMLAGFASAKILAIYVGKEGVGYYNQFALFVATAMVFSTWGISSGITKYVAEHKDNPRVQNQFISTGFIINIVGTLLATLLLISFSSYFNQWAFNGKLQASYLFTLLGAFIILMNLNSFVISVFNGFQLYRTIVLRNIYQACVTLMLHITLTIWFGLPGALIGLILTQTLIFFLLLPVMRHKPYLKPSVLFRNIRMDYLPLYAKFAIMMLVANIFGNLLKIFIQNDVIGRLGAGELGDMTSVIKISSLYLNIATGIIGLYFLPKFSAEKDPIKLGLLLRRTLSVIFAFVAIGGAGFFLLKGFLIPLFFKAEFLTATPLVKYQVIGDLFKGTTYVLGYLLIAKGKTIPYLLAEIGCGLTYYVVSKYLLSTHGIEALMIGYVVSNALYAIGIAIYARRTIMKGVKQRII